MNKTLCEERTAPAGPRDGLSSVEVLSCMRLRYFKRYPWVNRFTMFRRGSHMRAVRTPRPLLTSLHLTRIMNTVRHV